MSTYDCSLELSSPELMNPSICSGEGVRERDSKPSLTVTHDRAHTLTL